MQTLALLALRLRTRGEAAPEFPDLRQAYARFADLGSAPHFVRNEVDRATNSLNTLREQIMSLMRGAH